MSNTENTIDARMGRINQWMQGAYNLNAILGWQFASVALLGTFATILLAQNKVDRAAYIIVTALVLAAMAWIVLSNRKQVKEDPTVRMRTALEGRYLGKANRALMLLNEELGCEHTEGDHNALLRLKRYVSQMDSLLLPALDRMTNSGQFQRLADRYKLGKSAEELVRVAATELAAVEKIYEVAEMVSADMFAAARILIEPLL